MQTVYEAANAVEAHMLQDVLKQQGLAALVLGEHLQGGVGELPAAGLVRLVTDDLDAERARQLIAQWEATQPGEPTPPLPQRAGSRAKWFLLGVLVGAAAVFSLLRPAAKVGGIDQHIRDHLRDPHREHTLDTRLPHAAAREVMRSASLRADAPGTRA